MSRSDQARRTGGHDDPQTVRLYRETPSGTSVLSTFGKDVGIVRQAQGRYPLTLSA
jgi:hypothetical protein